jgi:DNA-binding transcriptional LysR family regulator
VPESVDIPLKRAAIMLADELNFSRAAEKLNIPITELRDHIAALETKLSLRLFEPIQDFVKLTDEGRALIGAFRKAVAVHDKEPS